MRQKMTIFKVGKQRLRGRKNLKLNFDEFKHFDGGDLEENGHFLEGKRLAL